MQGSLHAIGLIACPVLVVAVIAVSKRAPLSVRRICIAVLVSLLAMFIADTVSVHACIAGQPLTQWLVPGLCMVAVLCSIESVACRAIAGSVLALLAIALSLQFSHLVHEPGFTGNPSEFLSARDRKIRLLAELIAFDTSDSYPQGWVREVLPLGSLPEDDRAAIADLLGQLDQRAKATHAWHTWLTGLYVTEPVHTDVWYLGGPPQEGAVSLELRDRDTLSP